MKKKNFIRVAILAAVLAWPAVESYRLSIAKKELAASEERLQTVTVKLAKIQSVQVAEKSTPAAQP